MATVNRAFGERLRAAREAAGLTQVELAAILHVAQKQVSTWESGGMPRAGRLDAIAEAVGVSVGALFGSKGPTPSQKNNGFPPRDPSPKVDVEGKPTKKQRRG